jgi:catechol 2,3-dioxygenase-like lactoylglutathione lyase family enzyme
VALEPALTAAGVRARRGRPAPHPAREHERNIGSGRRRPGTAAGCGRHGGTRHDQGIAPQRVPLSRLRGDPQVLRGFPGLPLASALPIRTTRTGREANVLHTFYEMGDGSYLAFFEAPDQPFEFKEQHDFDLHIALEVDRGALDEMFARGKAAGIETRGISDHGFVDSIYFRDPNGYVIELTTRTADDHEDLDPGRARRILDEWQAAKPRA